MWKMKPKARVYLALGSTDMRRASNGLSALVEQTLGREAFCGDLFVFCNRNRTIIKILYWGKAGFCLWHQRLDCDRFQWPETELDAQEISQEELTWLLDGLDITQAHKQLEYSVVC